MSFFSKLLQLGVPRLAKDSFGNTVLMGADGVGYRHPVIYHKWSNTSFNGLVGNGVNVELDSLVIPAGTVGPNGRVLVEVAYEFAGNNNKDPLVRIGHGTNTWAAGAVNMVNNQGFSTQRGYRTLPTIVNKGAVNSNKIYVPQSAALGQTGSTSSVDSTIDFSQDVTIYFGGTMLNAFGDPADIVRLLWYTATVLR